MSVDKVRVDFQERGDVQAFLRRLMVGIDELRKEVLNQAPFESVVVADVPPDASEWIIASLETENPAASNDPGEDCRWVKHGETIEVGDQWLIHGYFVEVSECVIGTVHQGSRPLRRRERIAWLEAYRDRRSASQCVKDGLHRLEAVRDEMKRSRLYAEDESVRKWCQQLLYTRSDLRAAFNDRDVSAILLDRLITLSERASSVLVEFQKLRDGGYALQCALNEAAIAIELAKSISEAEPPRTKTPTLCNSGSGKVGN